MITGSEIRRMREEAGLSQAELAKLAKVTQAHVAKIEGGKVDPRLSTINRMLFALSKKEGKPAGKKCSEIMQKNVISVSQDDPVQKAVKTMKRLGISQMPVLSHGVQVGSIGETTIMHNFGRNIKHLRVRDVIDRPFPIVDMQDGVEILPGLLESHAAVLVSEKGKIKGIITKSDLLGVK